MNSKRGARLFLRLLACAVLLGAFCLVLFRNQEPVYQGRSLRKWLLPLTDANTDAATIRKTDEALDHIGTNAIPWLLQSIQVNAGSFARVDRFAEKVLPHWLREIWYQSAWSRRGELGQLAEDGFKRLGPRAKSAVPALGQLLGNREWETAVRAGRALAYMGKDGLPPLLSALTNRQVLHRDLLCDAVLSLDNTNVPLAVPTLARCLSDSDPRVAAEALEDLCGSMRDVGSALAALTNRTCSRVTEVRICAVAALRDYGLEAREAAVPALVRALEDADAGVREIATNGVRRVGPEVFRPTRRTHGSAAPNSVEGLLVAWSRVQPGATWDLFGEGAATGPDSPARQIILRGLGAVPELIELLDDRRPTARQYETMNGPPRVIVIVLGELAGELLSEITGIDPPQLGADPAPFNLWLEEARKLGEEEAIAAALFERSDGRITGVRQGPAFILAQRFPERLASLCGEFSREADPTAEPFYLVTAVARAKLPLQARVEMLAEFAQDGSLAQKRVGLQELAEIDPAKCAHLLPPVLRSLPTDATGPYWTCPEAAFTYVVKLVTDKAIWREYLQAARRSSVGLRLEMMGPMAYPYTGVERDTRALRLAFLSAFLDDKSERVLPGQGRSAQFDGPCAASDFARITVRDFAAMQIAFILELPDKPDESWTATQWTALRTRVRAKLASKSLPSLEEGR